MNTKAMMALGRLFEQGIGVKQDMAKALAYYSLASENFEPYAYYKIGVFLENGDHPECIDGKPNLNLAFEYFN
jgi:TPR repeat protein